MVTYARAASPYYRELYHSLPDGIDDSTHLPVTNKKQLMERFDDWVTDPAIRIDQLRAFVEDPACIGQPFLGRYTVATTSGTTGTRGIFLLDQRTMTVTNIVALHMLSSWLGVAGIFRVLARGIRMSMVMATNGHFASAVAATKLRRSSPRRARRIQVLSAHMPISALVEQLNAFQPTLLAPYASMASLLANEQEAGRLAIHPVLLTLAAEGLPDAEYARIAKVFDARVGNSYACTECPFLSYGCSHGWLHVNSDWVVLEPVDATYRPTPKGEQSHTVLLSNLANAVQPILRYDLGDSVLERPDACPCGNPLPAIRVRGRTADVLNFPTAHGTRVSIAPLAFEMDHVPGVAQCQVVQRAQALLIRLRIGEGYRAADVWPVVHQEITQLLSEHGVDSVAIERATEPPQQSPGGKFRAVIPLAP